MDELITDLFGVVIDGREAHVALIVHPDYEWIEVSYQHPLSDVEFSLKDHQRVLDVFLGYP